MKIPNLKIEQFQETEPLNGLYVNSFSNHIQLNKNLISKPHSHNFYLCVVFTAGTGTHEIDFHSYNISPGKVFFLQPGQTHFWHFKSPPQGYIFFHSQEFYEMQYLNHTLKSFPFYYSYQNPPLLDLNAEQLTEINQNFKDIHIEYQQSQLFRTLRIVNIINGIYIKLTRIYIADINIEMLVSSNYSKTLEHLEKLINAYFYTEKSPKFYANKLNITTKHLNRITQKTINKTTSQLISERVLLEAKRLIVHSDNNLAGIANILEFSDYAYFSKFFKSKIGINPIDFKKKYQE